MSIQSTRTLTREEAIEQLAHIMLEKRRERLEKEIAWELQDKTNEELADLLESTFNNYIIL